MHIQKCKICGKEYKTAYPNSRYCSAECRLAYQRQYHTAWRQKNHEHVKEYARNYAK